jgi:hypothetical protein
MEAVTSATTRVVARGLVPPASTASFMIPTHCNTGSGTAAGAGVAFIAMRDTSEAITSTLVAGRKRFVSDILLPPDWISD